MKGQLLPREERPSQMQTQNIESKKTDALDHTKTLLSGQVRDTISKVNRQTINSEKMFVRPKAKG